MNAIFSQAPKFGGVWSIGRDAFPLSEDGSRDWEAELKNWKNRFCSQVAVTARIRTDHHKQRFTRV